MNMDDVLRSVQQRYAAYRAGPVNREIYENDDMLDPNNRDLNHYFYVGESAISVIVSALIAAGKSDVGAVLDLPCGFGRVTRHLKAFFPDADVYASDLYPEKVEYCQGQLGARGIRSTEDLKDLQLPVKFDLIWCGSLLTHFDEPLFANALGFFADALSEGGVAIVTLHGRYSIHMQHEQRHAYLPDDRFALAEEGFRRRGFGYADYHSPETFHLQESYGVSISAPSFVTGIVERIRDVRIVGYQERQWDEHQDVIIFGKPGVYW